MMKKLLSAILTIVILTAFFMCASAESFDFSTYDDDALIALLDQVQQEIAIRKIEKTATLLPGEYKVGPDIPAGAYVAKMTYEGGWWADLYIYDSNDNCIFNETVYGPDNSTASVKGEGSWNITVEEGYTLKCNSVVELTIFAGVQFK